MVAQRPVYAVIESLAAKMTAAQITPADQAQLVADVLAKIETWDGRRVDMTRQEVLSFERMAVQVARVATVRWRA